MLVFDEQFNSWYVPCIPIIDSAACNTPTQSHEVGASPKCRDIAWAHKAHRDLLRNQSQSLSARGPSSAQAHQLIVLRIMQQLYLTSVDSLKLYPLQF